MDLKIFLTIIGIFQSDIILTGFSAAENFEEENQCADHQARCNSRLWRPCCQPNNQCRRLGWGASATSYYCRRTANLGESCVNDFDCDLTKNAFCNFDKVCHCEEKYMQVSGLICKPLLTSFCTTDHDCVPNYSICVDNHCTCKPGFISKSYYRCIPTPLGKSCNFNGDCNPREHMICSDSKICTCKENYMNINDTRCAPLLEEFCWNDEHCAVENSICISNVCTCKPMYFAHSNDRCVLTTLGKFCERDEDCDRTIHAKCETDKICRCRDLNIVVDKTICSPLLGGYCQKDKNESCFVENSFCVNLQCQCKPNYIAISNYKCIKSRLGVDCITDQDCREVKLAKCSKDKKCYCPTNMVSSDETVCLKVLGETCIFDDQCAVEHAICDNYQCQCEPMYKRDSDYYCTPDKIIK